MDCLSYITLLVLLLHITASQCEGHHRHAQRSRTRRDRYQDSFLSSYSPYNYYSSKLREERLLMEINERLSGIISELNQRKQQQPVYVPIYVPYYVPYYAPANTQISTTTKNEEKVGVNERNSFKTDPVLNTEDKRIEPSQAIPNNSDPMDCQIAIVACCRFSEEGQKQNCFRFYKCPEMYHNEQGCAKETISSAVRNVVDTYKPSKRHT